MPDTRTHRGPHEEDARLFAPAHLPALRTAVAELSWLLSRGYAPVSSLKLVGDRHELTVRQRTAVARCSCSDQALAGRLARRLEATALAGRAVVIDGYNLLITVESALAGGLVLVGRDTTCRDLASIHGTYRAMAETSPALELIGRALEDLGVPSARWLLDAPVSNSGRLRAIMLRQARDHNWQWSVELAQSPDKELMVAAEPVVSSDSAVLDACGPWANLACHIIARHVPDAWVVKLGE